MVERLIRETVPREKRALAHFKDAMARSAAYAVTRSMATDLGEDISEYSDEAAELTEELVDMPAVERGLTSGEVRKAYWAATEYTRDNLLPYLQEAFSEQGMDTDEAVDTFYDRMLQDEDVAVEAFSLGDEDIDTETAVERQEEMETLFNDPAVYEQIISDAADRKETAREYYDRLRDINRELVENGECGNVEHYGTVNHVHQGDVTWGGGPGLPGDGPETGPGAGPGPAEEPEDGDDAAEHRANGGIQVNPEDLYTGRLFREGTLADDYTSLTSREEDVRYDFHLRETEADFLVEGGEVNAYVIPEGLDNYRLEGDDGDWVNIDAAEEVHHLEDGEIEELMVELDGGRKKLTGFPAKHVETPGNYALVLDAEHPDFDGPIRLWDEIQVQDHVTENVLPTINSYFRPADEEEGIEAGFFRKNGYVSDNMADVVNAVTGPDRSPLRAAARTLDWFTGERHTYDDEPEDGEKISYAHALEGRTRKELPEDETRGYNLLQDLLSDFTAVSVVHRWLD